MAKPGAALRPVASARRAGYPKSVDTRARILAAALEEARARGIHNASLARIAARARVAIGSLNYHFGSREELLRELMRSLTTNLLSRLDAADPSPGKDFFESERTGMLVFLDHLRNNPAYLRLAGEIRLHEPDLYRRAVGEWAERIAARIREGISRGVLRLMTDAEIRTQAHFIVGAAQVLDQMLTNRREYPGDEVVVAAYIALLRGGLGANPRGRVERQDGRRRNAPGRER